MPTWEYSIDFKGQGAGQREDRMTRSAGKCVASR